MIKFIFKKAIGLSLLLLFSFGGFSADSSTYFQQNVAYKIDVSLDDKLHILNGTEELTYTNNSNEPIKSIYFHLWANAYSSYNTELAKQLYENGEKDLYHATEEQKGGYKHIKFSSNGKKLLFEYDAKNKDICLLYLDEPLKSGESLTLDIAFKIKIPEGIFSRMGHEDQAYQITQWYPKPAVFDKNGWHKMPYLDQGEFYSEFGSYDVKITLPSNYVVGATGDMVNGEKELEWLEQKVAYTKSVIDSLDYYTIDTIPLSDTTYKTLHFKQDNVHDFAWFADKRYLVLNGEIELPNSKRKVKTWAMFTNLEADLWKESINYLNDATYYYSLWNGDYPYNQVTAVQGALSAGAGMEYPNITIIGLSGTAFLLDVVITHEVGHNWFYGILGTNERDFPWMDEGLNSYNEKRYVKKKYPNHSMLGSDKANPIEGLVGLKGLKYSGQNNIMYSLSASHNRDQPIHFHSADYTNMNYGAIVYMKTALAFDYLADYLGQDLFDKIMQTYYQTWKFKHPGPNDLKKVFEEVSGKDLSWFFEDLLKSKDKIDYKLSSIKKNEANFQLGVSNKGDLNVPFVVKGTKDGAVVNEKWVEPIEKKKIIDFPLGDYDKIIIDPSKNMPEFKRNNNQINTSGIFKKMEPLSFRLLGLSKPEKTELGILPMIGYNAHDGVMLGGSLHNYLLPYPKINFHVSPMYGMVSNELTGFAAMYYTTYPKSVFSKVKFGVHAQQFSFLDGIQEAALGYKKVMPVLEIHMMNERMRDSKDIFIKLRNINIIEDAYEYNSTNNMYTVVDNNYMVNDLLVGIENQGNVITPYSASLNVQQHEDFVKMNLLAKYRFQYRKPKTGLDLRFFVGRFLFNNNADRRFEYGFSNRDDYRYDELFIGRTSSGTLSQQFWMGDGGFKNIVPVTTANSWLNAINIRSNVFTKYISVYADLGIQGTKTTNFKGDDIDVASDPVYNFGASLNIIPDIFEVYFPFYSFGSLNQLNYGQRIRFTLNLNQIKPLEQAGEAIQF